MLMVVQGHAVCEQSTSHDSNGDPDTVQSILGPPPLLAGFLNPTIKPVAKCITLQSQDLYQGSGNAAYQVSLR